MEKTFTYHIYWILTYLFSSDLIFPFFWSVLSWSLWLSLDISSSLEMQNHFIYIENKTELKTPLKTATIIMTHFVSRSNTFFVLCSRLCANLFFSDVRPSMSSNLQRTSKVFWQKPQDATRFLQYYCIELEEKVELVWLPESMLNKNLWIWELNKSYQSLFCFAIFTTLSYPGHIQYGGMQAACENISTKILKRESLAFTFPENNKGSSPHMEPPLYYYCTK